MSGRAMRDMKELVNLAIQVDDTILFQENMTNARISYYNETDGDWMSSIWSQECASPDVFFNYTNTIVP